MHNFFSSPLYKERLLNKFIFKGLALTSKRAFLSGLKSAAQMISYERTIGLDIIGNSLFALTATIWFRVIKGSFFGFCISLQLI
jgi:NADH:ubiquinone oxidoreductase subunit H